jgi:hypothetical protein
MDNLLRRISSALATSGVVRRFEALSGVGPLPFSAANDAGLVRSAAPGTQAANRKNLFAGLLEALHDSRRRQAAREIHRYRHLIQEARLCRATRSEKPVNADSDPLSPSALATFDPVKIHPSRRSTALNSRDRSVHAEG